MKFNKLLSLAIVLVLSVQSLYIPVQATSMESNLKEYDMLVAAGILDENTNLASKSGNVSRAALVKVAVDISMGKNAVINGVSENPYSDINENVKFYDEILFAHKIGFISTAEKFRPDDDIKYIETIKILLGALGYNREAERRGGFPDGYLVVADRIGLLNGSFDAKFDDPLSFDVFYRLIYNAVRCDITEVYEIVGSGDDFTIGYAPVEGKNLLATNFSIYEVEGIVTANKYATLTGASNATKDIIKIDGETYFVNNKTDVLAPLGYYVNALYHYNAVTDDKTAIYFEIDEKRNTTLEIDEENRLPDSDSKKFYYKEGKRNKNIEVSRSAAMIYNNGWVKFDKNLLYPENGTVTIIDNNNDQKVDVIKIMNYETFVVDSVISDKGIITNAFGGSDIILDQTDEKYDFRLLKNGKKLSIDNISQYNIISYAISPSGKIKLKTVIVSSSYVKGIADGYSDDKVVISDQEYKMSEYMKKVITLGSEGIFYLDAFGTIAFQETESGILFGYFNNMEKERKHGKDIVTVQIFSEHGRFVEVKLKEKILLNGSTITATEFYDMMSVNLADSRQLIEYKVNKGNEVAVVNTAINAAIGTEEEVIARENEKFRLSSTIAKSQYVNGGFIDLMKMGAETKVFFVPDQSVNQGNLSDFYIGNLKTDAYYENIKAYNMDCYLTPEVLVITESASTKHYETGVAVFNCVKQVADEYGNAVTAVEYWNGGECLTYPVLENETVLQQINELERGDVGRFSFNHQGMINGVELWFDKSNGFDSMNKGSAWGESTSYAVAEVIEIDYLNKRMVLNYDGYRIGTYTTPTIYVYDIARDKIYVGDAYDIKKGLTIFTTKGYLNLGTIIVFEK